MNLGTVLALFLVLFLLMPVVSRGLLQRRRVHALEALEAVRGTRVIAMVHRQETVGFLGVQLAGIVARAGRALEWSGIGGRQQAQQLDACIPCPADDADPDHDALADASRFYHPAGPIMTME